MSPAHAFVRTARAPAGWLLALSIGLVPAAAVQAQEGAATVAPAPLPVTAPDAAGTPAAAPGARKDPWEGFNRKVFGFNDAVDEAVLKPVAQAYRRGVPELVRAGVDNVFGNIGDVWSTVNHLLQGKVMSGGAMALRVATNTVFGLAGLLDPASEMGLERQSEDLGQTLGAWGFGAGPYLVLPFFGPSSLRDGIAFPVDRMAGPTALVDGTQTVVAVAALQVVSTRAGLLSASALMDDVALDRYVFLRDAYLSRRQNLVYDGNPPEEADDAQ